ncbi:MAG: hypothetical protein GC191_19150 [Azospirillum sp.]|nr:hypothetical protein [Azospirillum sp.]
MRTIQTRLATVSLIGATALVLGACSTTDQVARDQAAAAMATAQHAEQTAQQALATATDARTELEHVERSFNQTLRK